MKWALITGMYNVADVAAEFCEFHLGLGVDQILVADYGSDDGTMEAIAPYIRSGAVRVTPVPTHHFAEYDPSNALLAELLDQGGADWVSFQDPDEFLASDFDVRASLAEAAAAGLEAVEVRRYNMTGPGPVAEDEHYMSRLTLKVVNPDIRNLPERISRSLPSPWIFSKVSPKMILRPRAGLTVSVGDHAILGVSNRATWFDPPFELLHIPVRGFGSFELKVETTKAYLELNPEFEQTMGWHWRRWIDIREEDGLRQEYAGQFVDSEQAEALTGAHKLETDPHLADWIARGRVPPPEARGRVARPGAVVGEDPRAIIRRRAASPPGPVLEVPDRLKRGGTRDSTSADAGLEALCEAAACLGGGLELFAGRSMLDLGCGNKQAEAIVKYEVGLTRYLGLDVSAPLIDALQAAAAGTVLEFRHLDVLNAMYGQPDRPPLSAQTALPLGEETFDIVHAWGLFAHVDDRDLGACFRLLRPHVTPGGRFVFTLYLTPEVETVSFTDPERPLFRVLFGPGFVNRALTAAGWRVERVFTRDTDLRRDMPGWPVRDIREVSERAGGMACVVAVPAGS